jgi:excisionase family DNA binding protein
LTRQYTAAENRGKSERQKARSVENEMEEQRLFLKPIEAAAALGISKSKIYEMLARREIPSTRIGGLIRIPAQALKELVSQAMGEKRDGEERDGTESGKCPA